MKKNSNFKDYSKLKKCILEGEFMELLDVYDDQGQKTGKIIERGVLNGSLNDREHIAVAIIFIENSNHEFLIQKTSEQKGGLYSSTGGHVGHNEKPIDTIKREVLEELGIDISHDSIMDLGYLIFDFPIRFVFYLQKDVNLNDIILQQEEVDSVSYMSYDELHHIIEKGLMNKSHAKIFEYVLDNISDRK
mgnify:CR=1 FL=1